MSVNEMETYLSSSVFKEAMDHFRVGKWEEGFTKLGEVEKAFPMDHELRALRQEMEVRSRISIYEVEENKSQKLRMLRKYSARTLLAVLVLAGVYFAYTTYSGWIQRQWAMAKSSYSQNLQQGQLIMEFNNAQNLLKGGKPDEALAKLENIKLVNPDFPGLSGAITEAQNLQDIEVKYTQAMELLHVGDSAQALEILKQISQKMPNYRDVSLQIKGLQSQSEMDTVLQQADQAFLEGRYEDALSSYESLRLMDPTFQTSHVEDHLFQSYVKAAQALLDQPIPSLETLQKIDDYFSKALALKPLDRDALAARTQVRTVIEDGMIGEYITQAQAAISNAPDSLEAQQTAEKYLGMALDVRPNDPEVLAQYQLAQAYIKAISDFASGKWDSVIEQLEFVTEHQANYANATALQTLYDAYILRGSNFVSAGEYNMALEDFQRSAVIAQQIPDSEVMAFEAQTMIAEAQGLLTHYQEAVLIYQDALNSSGLRETITEMDTELTNTLIYAEYLSGVGNYKSAFYAYRNVIRNRVSAYDQTTVITVKSGEYLTMLARRYNTTVAAILAANRLNNRPRLTPNSKLIIPILH